MEAFSALLAFCAGNSPVNGELPARRPVTRSFDVFFDLCLKKRLSKQWRRLWFETLFCSLWRHCNVPGTSWKHFPRYLPFVRGIHRSTVNYPHKGQWRGALMFSLICVWRNGWANNGDACDLRRYFAHYDVIVMFQAHPPMWRHCNDIQCLLELLECQIMKHLIHVEHPQAA